MMALKSWNLSTKVVVAFSLLITVVVGSLVLVQDWQLRTSQYQALQERLMEIVQLAAPQTASVDDLLVIELDARPMQWRVFRVQITAFSIFLGILMVAGCVVLYLTQLLVVRPMLTLKQTRQSLENYSQNLELKIEEQTRKLKESQQLLDLVMNNIPQSIFWKDKDNVYLGCNRSFAQVANMKTEEIVGKTDYDMPWSREEADFYIECDRKVMQSGQPQLRIVEEISKGDGNHGWLETSKVPLYDLEGQAMGIIGIFQDITPYKEAEAAAQQASKAKSEFLANMSHELRTPLNGILGYAQILGRSQAIAEKEKHGIHIIHQCGSHLLTLINDVLDLSKIEARKLELHPTPLHFPALLQSVVEMCKIKAQQKGIDFIYQEISQLPESVKVDEKRLRQVLINLLGNAIKFTDMGSVKLQVEVLTQSDNHAFLLFQVIDTGIGIAQEDLVRLFEAFEQVGDQKKQSEGTGLGLAISQQIVQLMGGKINVASKKGEGSKFFFKLELPLVSDWVTQQTSDNVEQIIGYEHSQKSSILLVDDRWENRAVLSNLLYPLDFIILEAENGQSALEIIEEKIPDLVITDISMPVMDGLELLDQIRNKKELEDTKVIVSSASVSQADQQVALNRGSNAFLAKPVNATVLFQLIADALNLTWLYQSTQKYEIEKNVSSQELVMPPRSTLEEWSVLAKSGRILKLKSHLDKVKKSDEPYAEFIEPLLELAQKIQASEIEKHLQKYLND